MAKHSPCNWCRINTVSPYCSRKCIRKAEKHLTPDLQKIRRIFIEQMPKKYKKIANLIYEKHGDGVFMKYLDSIKVKFKII